MQLSISRFKINIYSFVCKLILIRFPADITAEGDELKGKGSDILRRNEQDVTLDFLVRSISRHAFVVTFYVLNRSQA